MDMGCTIKVPLLWLFTAYILLTLAENNGVDFQPNNDNAGKKEIEENLIPDGPNNKVAPKIKNSLDRKYGYLKWKYHHVPYKISRKMPNELRQLILEAIKTWNTNFPDCIQWTPLKKERDYVYFRRGYMCHSEVGRMYGRQLIVLYEANCNSVGAILHEMAHAVGLTHEHNRKDRDDYIQVLFLNIPYEWRRQYFIDEDSIMEDLGPYDYYSIMHYRQESPDRAKPAFKILKHNVNTSLIGQTIGLSEIDQLKVKKLYCPWEMSNENEV